MKILDKEHEQCPLQITFPPPRCPSRQQQLLIRLNAAKPEKLIILENDAPKAVLLSFDAYEALEEELEYLRLASLAFARIKEDTQKSDKK
jgi:PHD/YefM family antitoxin component YafN of YafNO toxin-antitoxin module